MIFTQSARAELIEAQDWYEREAPGLGRRFRQAIDVLVERMSNGAQQFPVVYKNARRALLRRFPYALIFVIEDAIPPIIADSCFNIVTPQP